MCVLNANLAACSLKICTFVRLQYKSMSGGKIFAQQIHVFEMYFHLYIILEKINAMQCFLFKINVLTILAKLCCLL